MRLSSIHAARQVVRISLHEMYAWVLVSLTPHAGHKILLSNHWPRRLMCSFRVGTSAFPHSTNHHVSLPRPGSMMSSYRCHASFQSIDVAGWGARARTESEDGRRWCVKPGVAVPDSPLLDHPPSSDPDPTQSPRLGETCLRTCCTLLEGPLPLPTSVPEGRLVQPLCAACVWTVSELGCLPLPRRAMGM